MKTGNKIFERCIYKLDSINKDKTIRDYILQNNIKLFNNSLFTERVRIELDNGYHDRSRYYKHWLYLRNATNWKRCSKTGLAITPVKNVFEGNISEPIELTTKTRKGKDWENAKHFIILQSVNNFEYIVIDIFKNFYPHKQNFLKVFVSEHINNTKIDKI